MKLNVLKGKTSKSIDIFIQNASVSTGAGLGGLTNATAGTAFYHRPGSNPQTITLAPLATITTAYASGGFVALPAPAHAGWYRLDIPDAALAAFAGVDEVLVGLAGGTNAVPVQVEIQLTSFDPNDAVRLGLSALPNAAHSTTGGLPTVGSGTGQITLTGGLASADTRQFLGSAVQITTGRPQVDTATMAAAVATQITTSQNNSIIDDSALASAAALTAQITFRQAIGLMSAALFGRTTASGNTFLTPDNAKTRIVGASTANERTSITLTPSG